MLTKRQQVAIAFEAAAGTAETLALADVVQHEGVAEYEPDVQITEKESLNSSLTPRGAVVGSRAAKIRFKMYLRGCVGVPAILTNAPEFHVPFQACGLLGVDSGSDPDEIITYKPSSTNISVASATVGSYATVGIFQDGKGYIIRGAQGNMILTFATGMPVSADFEMTGVAVAATDETLLVPVHTALVEPAFLGASLAIHGGAGANITELKLDLGNEIAMRPDPNSANGWLSAQIVGRKPTGSLDPEELKISGGEDFWADWLAGTLAAITTGVFGGANYNQFDLNVPKAQYTKVGLADRDGLSTAPIDYLCTANSDAGEDEFTFVVT